MSIFPFSSILYLNKALEDTPCFQASCSEYLINTMLGENTIPDLRDWEAMLPTAPGPQIQTVARLEAYSH